MSTLQRMTLLAVFLSGGGISGPLPAEALPGEPHIVVTGRHELRVEPDIVSLSLSISEVGGEVAAARNAVEQRSAKLIDTLHQLGVANKDISSAQLQITPHYNWNNRAQIYAGTEVARRIDITLRDITHYDAMIRAIIDANVARINTTRLMSSQEDELRARALQGAVRDARQKAELLVEGLEQRVGKVFSINAQAGGPVVSTRFQAAEPAAQDAFQPGEISISETVQVVFYLNNF